MGERGLSALVDNFCLRVVSYNVHGWEDNDGFDNFERVCTLLNQLRPEVVCLQEVKQSSKPYPNGRITRSCSIALHI